MNIEDELLDLPAGKSRRVRTSSIAVIVFIALNFFCLLLGFFFSLVEIESIVFSGAAMILLSLTLFVLALIQRKYYLLMQATSGLVFVVFILLLIVVKELSPSEAKKPVPIFLLMFNVLYLVPLALSFIKELRLPSRSKLEKM